MNLHYIVARQNDGPADGLYVTSFFLGEGKHKAVCATYKARGDLIVASDAVDVGACDPLL